MHDLISFGDITIDLFFKGDSLTQKDNHFFLAIGGKYSASYFHESLGGGGANVAVGCAHFGLDCAVIGKIGENPFKQMIIQKLVKKGVSCEFLKAEKEYMNISSILLDKSGERTIIHYRTPHAHVILNDYLSDKIIPSKIIYMGNMPDVSYAERIHTLSLFKKQSSMICLSLGILDCRDKFAHLKNLLACADILILNTHEYAELVKKEYTVIDFNKSSADLIQFDNRLLILTDGEKGSYAYYKKTVFYQKAIPPKKIVDTTGAGDAFTSGFLSTYLNHKDIQKAMCAGAEYASMIVSKIGAQ